MAQASENPLDPVLELTSTINEQKTYMYYLNVSVTGRCIDRKSETIEDITASEGTVNVVVSYSLRSKEISRDDQQVELVLTCNPEGLPGEITVLISEFEPPVPDGGYSPQSDGKSIIRFEKASRLSDVKS